MNKGNKEIRFRLDPETHSKIEHTQEIIQSKEKSAGAKLLLNLGYERIKDAVAYIESVSAPLTDNQVEDFFLSLKIQVKQIRNDRKARINKLRNR